MMMPRHIADETLRVYTPSLPDLKGDLDGWSLANQLFLENCAERLTALVPGGATRLKALDAVTMSLDGLTYRLTLRKGLRFHCGAEVTAQDAVATLLRVLGNRHSVAQLHQVVAAAKSERHGFAVQAVSRYRFEISLTRRVQDLLVRLALPELSLRHDGRACFSGLWRITEQDPAGFLLACDPNHSDAAVSHYKAVRWERFLETEQLGTALTDDPYLYVYPGTYYKSPAEEMMKDEILKSLDAGSSLLLKVRLAGHTQPEMTELRARINAAVKAAFGKPSLWRRTPLTSLVPKHHVLYTPFPPEPQPATGRRLRLEILSGTELLPEHVWQRFCQAAAETAGLDIELRQPVVVGDGPRPFGAEVRVVAYGHRGEPYTPLAQLRQDRLGRGELLSSETTEFLQGMPRSAGLLPFLSVPYLLRANRLLKAPGAEELATPALLRFADVRQSADHSRALRLKETALKALGAGVQMFAHDVRRPFAMVQGLLGLLEGAEDPARLKEIAGKYLPEVRAAAASVGRLIQDILEIGSDTEPSCEATRLADLVDQTLRESFAEPPAGDIQFRYDFAHQHQLYVDPQRLVRALSNIAVNAVEAMPGTGEIWFASRETGGQITLTVGNTGSVIPKELLAGIFDQFYTDGKKHGTGLGLAIVKKVVASHGGQVWCESDAAEGTRFFLTLPVAAGLDAKSAQQLPQRLADLRKHQRQLRQSSAPLVEAVAPGGLNLLLVDDDPVYMGMLQELFTEEERRLGELRFFTAVNGDEAAQILQRQQIAVAVVDVDLGRGKESGLEVAKRLRALCPHLKICVHSSGAPFELQKSAALAQADLFLPKPMAREHLLALMQASPHRLPQVALVDDDALMLEMWSALPGYQWHTFSSPSEMIDALSAAPDLLASLAFVIADYTFPGQSRTGLDLARELRAERADLPIFLATGRPLHAEQWRGAVDAVLEKNGRAALQAIEHRLGLRQGPP